MTFIYVMVLREMEIMIIFITLLSLLFMALEGTLIKVIFPMAQKIKFLMSIECYVMSFHVKINRA